jgi:hypothetical protein
MKKPPQKPPVMKVEGVDARRAARNVDKLRAKLTAALDDPNMRDQMVRAMREMMNEDKK